MTGHDVTWPQVTRSDPEVPSFVRKSPGSGRRRPKTGEYYAFDFLQGCSSQEEAVTWQEMMSRDLRWPEVTRKWHHLTGSHLEVAVEGRKLASTVRLTSYKAVARRRRHSSDRKWRHVTLGDRKWRHLTGSHLEVAVEGKKLAYAVFDFLEGCSLQDEAVTRQEMMSRDPRWAVVTRKWRHLIESHLKVAVLNRKLAYTVRLTSYKAVACMRRQSRDRKWRHVTAGDRKWPRSNVIWPKVTWKGL